MKIAFLGIGQVGGALAAALSRRGHEITAGTDRPDSDSVARARERIPALRVAGSEAAVRGADLVVLAVPFPVAPDLVAMLRRALADKVLVDCTNPVGTGITHAFESRISGSEHLQKAAPEARFVKAFTIYGFENFEDSTYPGYSPLRPAMLIAGDDAAAKATVGRICDQLGFEPVDSGPLSSSLHLEHMTLLWIKMARVQGLGAGITWALLRR